MAFLGDVGKFFGLGSTQQVLTSAGKAAALAAAGQPQLATTQLSGAFANGTQQGQSVAVSQATQTQPQETQSSSTQAGFGALLGPAAGAIRTYAPQAGRFLMSPQGQIATGIGLAAGGAAISFMDPMTGQPKRLTRKMQAQVKQMVEIIGIETTAATLGLSVMEVAQILTYKFRRRSAGITGAQLRTAQRVNNKVIHMHDKLKAAYGTAARRTTTRRAVGTRVTQIKN
tara:strand:+ start:321 stop:1004 length:684 start_codon:yes stop_codon:yes gene_type:complete